MKGLDRTLELDRSVVFAGPPPKWGQIPPESQGEKTPPTGGDAHPAQVDAHTPNRVVELITGGFPSSVRL